MICTNKISYIIFLWPWKRPFFVYYQIWYIFLISFPGASIRGGGQLPPQFYISVSSPAMLAGSPLNIFATPFPLWSELQIFNYFLIQQISFSSGSLWFRNFRQFSVAVKKMASEHARITNSKQHLLTEVTFSLSDGSSQFLILLQFQQCSDDWWYYCLQNFAFCTTI